MNLAKKKILSLVDKHAQRVMESEYDREVAISAIGAARKIVHTISDELPPESVKAHVLTALADLMMKYADPDGQYTSGKGVIGSLYDDVYACSC